MKLLALAFAVMGLVLASDIAPVFASKMDGRCCQSSDGGRSYRYRVATLRAQVPMTCSAYAAACARHYTGRSERFAVCRAAGAQCMQTGVYVGPFSGEYYTSMRRM